MTTLISCVLLAATPAVECTGVPTIDSPQVRTVSHNARLELQQGIWHGSSLTVFKNDSGSAVTANLNVPHYVPPSSAPTSDTDLSVPAWTPSATWGNQNLSLNFPNVVRTDIGGTSVIAAPEVASVRLGAGATVALRLTWTTSPATTGYGGKQATTWYVMPKAVSIGQTVISFGYQQSEVFNLPKLTPNWSWQISRTGAFGRWGTSHTFAGERVTFTYFKGGFGG